MHLPQLPNLGVPLLLQSNHSFSFHVKRGKNASTTNRFAISRYQASRPPKTPVVLRNKHYPPSDCARWSAVHLIRGIYSFL